MLELLNNPIILIGGVIILLAIVGGVVLLIVPDNKQYVMAIIFQSKVFKLVKCESVAGIASYKIGGFNIDPDVVIPFQIGATVLELGDTENRKKTIPLFLSRWGDTGAIKFKTDGEIVVHNMNRTEYERRENLAAEIARGEGANKLTSIDLVNVGLVGTVILLAVVVALLGLQRF